MTSPREVLEKYFGRPLSMEWDGEEGFSNKESITIALSDLAEIVRSQQKDYVALVDSANEVRGYLKLGEVKAYNLAITDIAKLFTDKEV